MCLCYMSPNENMVDDMERFLTGKSPLLYVVEFNIEADAYNYPGRSLDTIFTDNYQDPTYHIIQHIAEIIQITTTVEFSFHRHISGTLKNQQWTEVMPKPNISTRPLRESNLQPIKNVAQSPSNFLDTNVRPFKTWI